MKWGMNNEEWEKIKQEVSQTNKKRETKKAFYRDPYSRRDNIDKHDREIVELKILDDNERFQYQMRDSKPEYHNIIYITAYNKTENTYKDAHYFIQNLVWKD